MASEKPEAPSDAPAADASSAKAPAGGDDDKTQARPDRRPPAARISEALKAKRLDEVAALLPRFGERVLLDGGEALLGDCFAALGDATVAANPHLATLHAWLCVYTERYDAAVPRLAEAERALRRAAMSSTPPAWMEGSEDDELLVLDPFAELRRDIAAVRAHLAWVQGDLSHVPDAAEDLMPAASADHPVWRASALVTLARCHALAGELEGASHELDAALAATMVAGTRRARRVTLEAQVTLARVRFAQADLGGAAKLYEEVVANAGDDDLDARDGALIGLGRVAFLRDELEAAEAKLTEGLARIHATSSPFIGVDGQIALGGLHLARQSWSEATACLNAAEAFAKAHRHRWALELINAERARFALVQGNLGAARRWSQQFALRGEDELGPVRERQLVTHGRCLAAQGDAEEALAALAAAREQALAGGRKLTALDALIHEALALDVSGARAQALERLAEAQALAAPSGVTRPFVPAAALVAAAPKPKPKAEAKPKAEPKPKAEAKPKPAAQKKKKSKKSATSKKKGA